MRYLLDTCVLIWTLTGEKSKIKSFLKILNNPEHEILVSVVSYWEISIKSALGKLKAPDNLIEVVSETGFLWMNLTPLHVKQLSRLPLIHSDPFDRLLIAQSQHEKIPLLTTDQQILQYET